MSAQFTPGKNGRNQLAATAQDGSSIVVYEQGGHLAHWRNAAGEEQLYLSPKAVFRDGVALRGGVPLIFPQFGSRGPMKPSHGFARLRRWAVEAVEDGRVVLTLTAPATDLGASGATGDVRLRYTISFSNERLRLGMEVANGASAAVEFHFCFHSYFPVDDISTTIVNGFNRAPYLDQKRNAMAPPQEVWTLKEETDRVYASPACAILLQDTQRPSARHISAGNLPDVVLWNPWVDKCAALSDMPKDGYKKFICIEHGQILKRTSLRPGATWACHQTITLLQEGNPSSKL